MEEKYGSWLQHWDKIKSEPLNFLLLCFLCLTWIIVLKKTRVDSMGFVLVIYWNSSKNEIFCQLSKRNDGWSFRKFDDCCLNVSEAYQNDYKLSTRSATHWNNTKMYHIQQERKISILTAIRNKNVNKWQKNKINSTYGLLYSAGWLPALYSPNIGRKTQIRQFLIKVTLLTDKFVCI